MKYWTDTIAIFRNGKNGKWEIYVNRKWYETIAPDQANLLPARSPTKRLGRISTALDGKANKPHQINQHTQIKTIEEQEPKIFDNIINGYITNGWIPHLNTFRSTPGNDGTTWLTIILSKTENPDTPILL